MTVWCCGSNGKFQLGLGHDRDLNELVPVLEGQVDKITGGGNHTLMLMNGDIYAAGDNSSGQCALDSPSLETFTLIPRIDGLPWIDCSCGYEFSVFVNGQGVYTSGIGPRGELGVMQKKGKMLFMGSFHPQSVKSCVDHSVMSIGGALYGWGNGRYGKLGGDTPKVWGPVCIGKGNNYSLGKDFTVVDGKIMGKDYGIKLPDGYEELQAMWTSVHCKTSEGIVSQGNNSHGQIASLPSPRLWSVGSEHGIAVYGNTVKCWGWGEHGNVVEHEFEDAVVAVYGGCATTWVVTS